MSPFSQYEQEQAENCLCVPKVIFIKYHCIIQIDRSDIELSGETLSRVKMYDFIEIFEGMII